VRTFVPEGLSESSPVRSAGLAFLEGQPSRKGRSTKCWQSLSHVQHQKPNFSIVPSAQGTIDEWWQSLSRARDTQSRPFLSSLMLMGRSCFLLHFPALRTGLLSSGSLRN
jgi:hypothetical protein